MRCETHMKSTLEKLGVEAVDVHQWIDALFDHSRYRFFIKTGVRVDGFDPYDHRRHRHCMEAEDECVKVFVERYPEAVVRAVFEQHIRDDYEGDYPRRDDFDDPAFQERHHRK